MRARSLIVAGTAVASFALVAPGPAMAATVWDGGSPTDCASVLGSAPDPVTYLDSSAPTVSGLRWRVRSATGTYSTTGMLTVPAGGALAYIRGLATDHCSGVGTLAGEVATRALLRFSGASVTPYPLRAESLASMTDVTVIGTDRRWCPGDVGVTSLTSATTRQRYSSFAVTAPATLSASTDQPVDTTVPATGLGIRTQSRLTIAFSSKSIKKGRSLTIYGVLQRRSSLPRAAGAALNSACGADKWTPIPRTPVTLIIEGVKGGKFKVIKTVKLTADAQGRVQYPYLFPGVSRFQWTVAAVNLKTWVAASKSQQQFVVPT
ncbi:MAG: hypothetical protein WCP26_11535 [Actinomycetes bacterium]